MQHQVLEHQLVHGARLLTVQIPNTITFYWSSTFRAGYRFVAPEVYELPHLAEHLAFEGTKTYPDALAFKVEIERDGTYFNAGTSYDQVSYFFSGSREELARIIKINMSQIYEPLYRDETIKQEKDVIIQEMSRKKEEDSWRAGYTGIHQILPERNPDIDDRIAQIPQITRQDLLAYHEQCYGVANTAFILAGDYSDAEVDAVIEQLNQALADRPVGKVQRFHQPKMGDYQGKVLTLPAYKDRQSHMWMEFVQPGRSDEFYPALRVMSVLLTGGLSSRLQRKAREAGLTYSIRSGSNISHDYTALGVSSQTSADKLEALIELTARELQAIGAGEITDDELGRAIGYITGVVRRSYQTPAHYAGWYADRFLIGEELEGPESWVERVQAVDRTALAATYRKFICDDCGFLVLVGNGLKSKQKHFEKLIRQALSA